MGRQRRPYLPGAVFHLTARTVRKRHWLTGRLRTEGLELLADAAPRSGMRLLAVAFMSNHLHIVVQQGERPLSALMQPLLRGLAYRVHDAHNVRGPVFWRHYGSRPCLDPSYARNAIAYTHLNPVRAGLCDDPADYRWTSHALYVDGDVSGLAPELRRLATVLEPHHALPLFATAPGRSTLEMRGDYCAFIDARMLADTNGGGNGGLDASGKPSDGADAAPPINQSELSPLFHEPAGRVRRRWAGPGPDLYAPDLATLARATLAAEAPDSRLSGVRGRGGGKQVVRLRNLVIRRLHAAGFRNVDIARFLDVSTSTVSRIVRQKRDSGAPSV